MVKKEAADLLEEIKAGLSGTGVEHDVARSVCAAPMRQLQVTLPCPSRAETRCGPRLQSQYSSGHSWPVLAPSRRAQDQRWPLCQKTKWN